MVDAAVSSAGYPICGLLAYSDLIPQYNTRKQHVAEVTLFRRDMNLRLGIIKDPMAVTKM